MTIRRTLGMALGLLCSLAPVLGQNPAETPARHASREIPLRYGSVDAISGTTTLRIPLGPRLPGRLPVGFVYAKQWGVAEGAVNVAFLPVVWNPDAVHPAPLTDPVTGEPLPPPSTRVFVDGETWTFYRNALPPAGGMPTRDELIKWCHDRGVDLGTAPAGDYAEEPELIIDAIPSSDGTKYLINSRWKVREFNPRTGGYPTKYILRRRILIHGPNAIWQEGTTTWFTNRHGDRVTMKGTGPLLGAPESVVIKDERSGLTLAANINTLVPNVNNNDTNTRKTSKISLVVSNNFGLPTSSATGIYCSIAYGYYPFLSDPNTLTNWYGYWVSNENISTSVNGESRTIAFGVEADSYVAMLHENALKEVFDPASATTFLPYGGEFDPKTGNWYGICATGANLMGYTPIWPGTDYEDAKRGWVRKVGPGVSMSVHIARKLPQFTKAYRQKTFTYVQPHHITSILTFPTAYPDASSAYRGVRLTHAAGGSWGSTYTSPQAYLFMTSAVLAEEEIHGTGYDSTTGQPLSPTVNVVRLYDGWDLRSWSNPAGTINSTRPSTPIARRTRIYERNLPVKEIIAGPPGVGGSEDERGPLLTREYTLPPVATLPVPDGTQPALLSAALTEPAGYLLRREGRITRTWNRPWAQLQTLTDTKTLDGPRVQPLRGVPSVDFGTTTFAFNPGTGMLASTTGVRGSDRAVDARAFNAQTLVLESTSKSVLSGGVSLPYSGQIGTSYGYDSLNRWVVSETDRLTGRTTQFQRNERGQETWRRDPNGVQTWTTYDDHGRVQRIEGPGRPTQTFEYASDGRWRIERTFIDNKVLTTRYDLDAAGRVEKVTFPDGSTQTTTFDGWGQKIRQSPVLKPGQTSHGDLAWVYDERGRVVETRDRVTGAATTGRLITQMVRFPTHETRFGRTGIWSEVRDARGGTTWEMHDELGQKAVMRDALGQETTYAYDRDGRLAQTQQGAQVRAYAYNNLGWLTSRTEPEEGTTTFGDFTAAGLPRLTRALGRSGSANVETQTILDAKHRPARIEIRENGALKVARALTYREDFNAVSQLTESQPEGTLTETYGYDGLGRLNAQTVSDGSHAFAFTRTFDSAGQVESLTYPAVPGRAAETVHYGFDALNRPQTVQLGSATRAQVFYGSASGMAYTDTIVYGNNTSSASKFEKNELLEVKRAVASGLPAGQIQTEPLAWDAAGQLVQRGSDTFSYDLLGRLSGSTVFGLNGEKVVQAYGYDPYGNRTAHTVTYTGSSLYRPAEALSWTAAYDARNGLPATLSSPSGALTTGCQYDDLGRLSEVWAIPGQSSTFTRWTYDPSGRMVQESVGGVLSRFLLDAGGRRFRRVHAEVRTVYTVYGFGGEVLMILEKPTPTGALAWKQSNVYGPGGLVSEEKPEGTFYVMGDQVGSPSVVTNSSGVVVGLSKNLPFGERLMSPPDKQQKAHRRFTNHEDQPGSAIYMQARSYLPAYGKFAQVDPAYDQTKDDPGTWNLYSYCGNNPVTRTDPDGRKEIFVTPNDLQNFYNASHGFTDDNSLCSLSTYNIESGVDTLNGGMLSMVTLSGGSANNGSSLSSGLASDAESSTPSSQTGTDTSKAAININDIKISGLPFGDWLSWVISGKSPDYNPGSFNDGGSRNDGVTVQGNTNCYAYSCDQKGPFGGQFGMNPGTPSGNPLRSYGDITAQGIGDRAVKDGLSKTFVPGSYPVAYVIAKDAGNGKPDYHWYRLDSNGFWSHKPGSTPATNLDYSGNRISDPAAANRGPYTNFGGILWVPPGFKF